MSNPTDETIMLSTMLISLRVQNKELEREISELKATIESSLMLTEKMNEPKIEQGFEMVSKSYAKFVSICIDILQAHKVGDKEYICTTEMHPFIKRIDIAMGLRKELESE